MKGVVNYQVLNQDAVEPLYKTKNAAGADISAAEAAILKPGERRLISTGLALEIPPSYECQIRPRSGLALNHGITVLNAPGTVDSDYRGEIKVLLVNLGTEAFEVRKGDRIAQLIFASVPRPEFKKCASLTSTGRGTGGYGSTGKSG